MVLGLASVRDLPFAEWKVLAVMDIACGPDILITPMAPPDGVANAQIVSVIILLKMFG